MLEKEPSGRKRQVGGHVDTLASGSVLVSAPTGYGKTLVYLPLPVAAKDILLKLRAGSFME